MGSEGKGEKSSTFCRTVSGSPTNLEFLAVNVEFKTSPKLRPLLPCLSCTSLVV